MITSGCNDMPVKYALAFAIIVMSLAGAYYLLQQAAEQPTSQQPVQEQQEANTTSQSVSQNVTNTTRQVGNNATAPACTQEIDWANAGGSASKGLKVSFSLACPDSVRIYVNGHLAWNGTLKAGTHTISIPPEKLGFKPSPGDQAIVEIRASGRFAQLPATFGP